MNTPILLTRTKKPRPAATITRTVDVELADLGRDGATGRFSAAAGASICCERCGAQSLARACEVIDLRRVEDESDPTSMAAVVSLACPVCHHRGALVLGYGPAACAKDQDTIAALGVQGWKRDHAQLRV
jgi:hypothetical protein